MRIGAWAHGMRVVAAGKRGGNLASAALARHLRRVRETGVRMPELKDAQHKTDICIIGAGPVGLFAVFECGMLKMHCHVVDALT